MIEIMPYIEGDEQLINPVVGITWEPTYTDELHTIHLDGNILGIAGVECHGGEYYVAAYTDRNAIAHPVQYLRTVKKLIQYYIERPEIDLLITMMEPSSPYLRWLRLLGFVRGPDYEGWHQYEYRG